PAEKAAAFLASADPAKRRKLIDELLASPKFGSHLADLWAETLLKRTSDSGRIPVAPFIAWLRDGFNANRRWDETVREIVTATGTQKKTPAVTYFLVNNTVDRMTDNATRSFLGVQLQCAQCHEHPFTAWKRDDYWGVAAFFMKVRSGNVGKVLKSG